MDFLSSQDRQKRKLLELLSDQVGGEGMEGESPCG
jgi:hypothetical protein